MSAAYRLVLSGAQEAVGGIYGSGGVSTSASGTGYAIYDSTAHALSYSVLISGLDFGPFLGGAQQTAGTTADNVTDMHFHSGARSVSGGIILGLKGGDLDDFNATITPTGATLVTGRWETTDSPSLNSSFQTVFSGTGSLGSDIPVYMNVHTMAHGGGEIRGQFILISTDNSETVSGTAGVDTLPGLGGNDVINAMAGADVLMGGAGNDTLNGGAGADSLDGQAGMDTATYAASMAKVSVNLTTGHGSGGDAAGDTLTSVERLIGSAFNDTLTGSAGANTLTGGKGIDTLKGMAGGDMLNGGLGQDTLTGGAGSDSFVFNTTPGAGNVDTITDYDVATDTIRLENAVFIALGAPGVLSAAQFQIGAAADGDDHIIYDSATGALSYDPDGVGGLAQIQFATLSLGLALTAADFVVI